MTEMYFKRPGDPRIVGAELKQPPSEDVKAALDALKIFIESNNKKG